MLSSSGRLFDSSAPSKVVDDPTIASEENRMEVWGAAYADFTGTVPCEKFLYDLISKKK